MSRDKAIELAMELIKLGVSNRGVEELLQHPLDTVERQLHFLPYRKAKRPEAFIIDAVRNNYSPPKEYFIHASTQTQPPKNPDQLDQGAELLGADDAPDPFRHRTPGHPHSAPPNSWVEQSGSDGYNPVPEVDAIDW